MPEVRPIDANALIGFLHNQTFIDGDDRSLVYKWIEEQPTIKSEQRRGHIEHRKHLDYCSECGAPLIGYRFYCGKCGADMREGG